MSLVNPIELLWNYLRARGEYSPVSWSILRRKELPPRTRRIRTEID